MTGTLGRRLDAIHVRVRAPGADIEVELRHRRNVSITFGEGTYEFLRPQHLERALTGAARLLYAGWLRQYRTALAGSAIGGEQDPRFVAARDRIESSGRSNGGHVTISAVGMEDIQVRVAPRVLDELTERQFADAVRQAAAAFLTDQAAKIDELRRALFG